MNLQTSRNEKSTAVAFSNVWFEFRVFNCAEDDLRQFSVKISFPASRACDRTLHCQLVMLKYRYKIVSCYISMSYHVCIVYVISFTELCMDRSECFSFHITTVME